MNEPVRLCHETIYQAIQAMPKGELRTETIALLRHGHNRRRPRMRGQDRRGQIPNMTSIDLRPADIKDRLVPGREIAVNHDRNEDVYVALRDAFDAAKRQLEDYVRQLRGDVKIHEQKRLVLVEDSD